MDDNLKAYEEHLKDSQKPIAAATHATLPRVPYVKRVTLGHTEWVEALQRGSEVLRLRSSIEVIPAECLARKTQCAAAPLPIIVISGP